MTQASGCAREFKDSIRKKKGKVRLPKVFNMKIAMKTVQFQHINYHYQENSKHLSNSSTYITEDRQGCTSWVSVKTTIRLIRASMKLDLIARYIDVNRNDIYRICQCSNQTLCAIHMNICLQVRRSMQKIMKVFVTNLNHQAHSID